MGTPDGLHERGAALWSALGHELNSPLGVLALEACRTVDRLDDLDRIIACDESVLQLMRFRIPHAFNANPDGEVHVTVEFSNVLAEARQQQSVLRQMLVTLGLKSGDAPANEGDSPLAAVLKLVSEAKSSGRSS